MVRALPNEKTSEGASFPYRQQPPGRRLLFAGDGLTGHPEDDMMASTKSVRRHGRNEEENEMFGSKRQDQPRESAIKIATREALQGGSRYYELKRRQTLSGREARTIVDLETGVEYLLLIEISYNDGKITAISPLLDRDGKAKVNKDVLEVLEEAEAEL